MATFLVVELLVAVVASYIAVIVGIPWYMTSVARSRMWYVRDKVIDEVGHGLYENEDEVRKLIQQMEQAIDLVPELTAWRYWLVHRLIKREPLALAHWKEMEEQRFDPRRLSADDAFRLRPHYEAFRAAVERKRLVGSPSGWVVLVWTRLRTLGSGPHDKGSHTQRPVTPRTPPPAAARFVEVDDLEYTLRIIGRNRRHDDSTLIGAVG